MLFIELKFFVFFSVVLIFYWTSQSNSFRKWLLFAASYFFYGSWDYRFAVMLFILSTADYLFALRIDESQDPKRRKFFVTASLFMNLSVLAYFKYCNFFVDSAVQLANTLGAHLSEPTLNIILPVGVSFFTFQSLSYTLDVYRSEIKAVHKARDYLLFAAFFPQLVAGPIVRPKYFLPQLDEARTISSVEIKSMLLLFLVGFIKKACIADNVSPFVDQVFANPLEYSGLASITAIWLYSLQIYCDFSGYSDMAIAVAGLLGYKLALNFNAPYLAVSIQDFWRRWHISLSSWIRDYIYISLGGRSKNRWLTYRNIIITMLAGGLWHGAAWTFVVWGGLHGLSQALVQEFKRYFPASPQQEPWRSIFGWFLTLNFVCICWILFRSSTFSTAYLLIQRYLLLDIGGSMMLPLWLLWLPPILLFVQWLVLKNNLIDQLSKFSARYYCLIYGAVLAIVVALLPFGHRPFIYFQF